MKNPLFLFRALAAVLISTSVLFALSFAPLSCSMDGGLASAMDEGLPSGADEKHSGRSPGLAIQRAVPPVLESFTVDAEDAMCLQFDKAVSIDDANLFRIADRNGPLKDGPGGGLDSPIAVTSEPTEDEKSVRLHFSQETEIGSVYEMKAVAWDDDGNSLTFSISFDAYNARMPDLLLCEIRNAYSSKQNKYEYIRLYCAKSGNLSGLELVNAGDGDRNAYSFPPVEVTKGEYVCVHLRKMKDEAGGWKQEGMLDEADGDIRASLAVDSADNAWDFWQDNQKSRLSPSDIVLLRNRSDGRVLDAFLFRDPKKDDADWNAKFQPLCTAVAESGRWLDAGGQASAAFESAFRAEGITSSAVTRTMKRRNLESRPSSAADWYVAQRK